MSRSSSPTSRPAPAAAPLPDLAAQLVEAALAAGADAADALAVAGSSVSIDVRGGRLEQAEREEGTELGLRVLLGQRQACVAASDTRPQTLREMAARAVTMARLAPEDPWLGLATPAQLSPRRDAAGLELADPAPPPGPAELEEAARRMEAVALAVDGVSKIDSASASTWERRVHLVASNGFSGGYARSGHALACVAITGEGTGMERDYAAESRSHHADLPTPEEVAALAAQRTLERRGARPARAGAWPVVFDERVSASLIGHLLGAINGASVARGSSWLRDALGAQVLPAALSLHEEPLRPRGPASRPFDAEGLASAPRALVAGGVLGGWVLDLASARQLGMESTASASRAPSSPPSPAVSNVVLTPGSGDRAALLRQMGTGLLVTSLIGATINPTTGDYSRGASGWWVEGGELRHPVSGVTIAGNLREMLRSLVAADDARPWRSAVVPSLLVEGLTLASA